MTNMDSSLIGGILLGLVMIGLILAPNYFFRLKTKEEIGDEAIKAFVEHFGETEKDK